MRQCPLKYKECPLKHPLSGRVVHLFEIQVPEATNGQKNGPAEESNFEIGNRQADTLKLIESINDDYSYSSNED